MSISIPFSLPCFLLLHQGQHSFLLLPHVSFVPCRVVSLGKRDDCPSNGNMLIRSHNSPNAKGSRSIFLCSPSVSRSRSARPASAFPTHPHTLRLAQQLIDTTHIHLVSRTRSTQKLIRHSHRSLSPLLISSHNSYQSCSSHKLRSRTRDSSLTSTYTT